MTESRKEYREIVKATSLFSGVQIMNILFSIIRSKVAAVFIGPVGMGILGVLNATLNLITGITKMGLDISAVKEIALAKEQGEDSAVKEVVSTLSKLLQITGIVGALATMLLSSWLSQIAFGSKEFTFSFFWIALAVLFRQLTVGNMAILQGLRRLKGLAKVNLFSSFISVLIVIPLYYFFGVEGIVPVIILTALTTYLFSRYFAFPYKEKSELKSIKKTFDQGRKMIRLGLVLSLSGLITILVAYIVQVYITNVGGIDEVGLYNAGIVIVNSYVGMVFSAMSKEYFPRLSAIADDIAKAGRAVTYQASIAILLLTPIIIAFLVLVPVVIKILYTEDFLPISGFITFALLSTPIKAVSWSIGYVIIAKGDAKVFVKTAIGFNTIFLIMNILAYDYYGLTGIGVSFILYYVLHLVVLKIITGRRYGLRLEPALLKVFFVCVILCTVAFLITFLKGTFVRYSAMALIVLISVFYSYKELNTRLDLAGLIQNFFKKK